MKTRLIIASVAIAAVLLMISSFALSSSQVGVSYQVASSPSAFVGGLDKYILYSPADGSDTPKSMSFRTSGVDFKAFALWYEGCVVVAVEDGSGRRSILFKNGRLAGSQASSFTFPRIGFSGAWEFRTNQYQLACHDFTNDGEPELLLAVSDGSDGIAVFVLSFSGSSWVSIGEMVTAGKGLGGCRVFRQAVTMKNPEGILFSWTCHGTSFDFLSSDHSDDPRRLF